MDSDGGARYFRRIGWEFVVPQNDLCDGIG